MPQMDDRQLLSVIDYEFRNSMGAESGEISTERAKAWNYYLSKTLGNEVEGSSQVVTSDVADVVDSIMPSLLRIFTTADNLCDFDSVSKEIPSSVAGNQQALQAAIREITEDDKKAQQESDYVNHVFFKENPAFYILFVWFFDALVQKNGIVKAWWDDSETVTTESYVGLSLDEVSTLLDDPELEPVERAERIQETVDEATGQLVEKEVHDIEFRRVSKLGQVRVENVPPEEYRISSDARVLDPSAARMVGHEREVPRSDLLSMGFDPEVVEDLPTQGEYQSDEESIARYDREDEHLDNAHDPSQEMVTLREAYIKVDYDGDGRSELRQVFTAGGHVLSNEPADRQPFHVICPQPLPHKHFGRATAEKVMDVQDIQTTLLRQVLDNLYHTNNPSHAVWEQGIGENTLDDLLTARVGSVKRFARPVGESYAPLTVPFTAGATFPMLDYFEKVKRDRTGISSDGEGLDPDSLKNIQQSVMASANDLGRMKVEAVARIFAETGLKTLFLHIHELLLKHQNKAKVLKLRNEYVPVNPQEWRTRRNMTVNIGLGVGSRESKLVHLEAIWNKQSEMVQGGGMNLTVTPQNLYQTAAEIVKNADLRNPQKFFTDPGQQLAPPPSDQQQELEKMQAEIEQRRQQLDAQRQQNDEAKLELERREAAFDAQRKSEEFQHKRQMEIAKLQQDSERLRLEIAKAETEGDVSASKLEIEQMLAQVNAVLTRAQAFKTVEEAQTEAQANADGPQETPDDMDEPESSEGESE